MVRKLDLFPYSGERVEDASSNGPKAVSNPSPVDRNRTSFR
jgi:hypothetical protein